MTQTILDDLVRIISDGLKYFNESHNYRDLIAHIPAGAIEERARNIAQAIVCRYELEEVSFDADYAHVRPKAVERPGAEPVNDRRQEERPPGRHKGNVSSCCGSPFVFDRRTWTCANCWGAK